MFLSPLLASYLVQSLKSNFQNTFLADFNLQVFMMAAYIRPLLYVLKGESENSISRRVDSLEKELEELKERIGFIKDSDSESINMQKLNASLKTLSKKDAEFREFIVKKLETLDKRGDGLFSFIVNIFSPWFWIRKIFCFIFGK